MKYKIVCSVIIVLFSCAEPSRSAIQSRTSELSAGDMGNIGGESELRISPVDDPNYGQQLLSHTFISSAHDLFNTKDGQSSAEQFDNSRNVNNNVELLLLKPSSTINKYKDENVGYYSPENDGNNNDVNLENFREHSFIDRLTSINNRLPRRYRAPVQCVQTEPMQLYCIHGDVIYKLKLPNAQLSEEEIGQLVETVYKEVELKRKAFGTRKKRVAIIDDNAEVRKIHTNMLPWYSGEKISKVMKFPIPADVDVSDTNPTQDTNTAADDGGISLPEEIHQEFHQLKPPSELFDPVGEQATSFSSKWFAKRHAISTNRIEKRRIIPPRCYRRTTTRKPSINDGKTSKCQLPASRRHCCRLLKPCKCTHVWPKIPQPTTCPPLPPLRPEVMPTRCPAYAFTTHVCPTAGRSKSTRKSPHLIMIQNPGSTTTAPIDTTDDVEEDVDDYGEEITTCPADEIIITETEPSKKRRKFLNSIRKTRGRKKPDQ